MFTSKNLLWTGHLKFLYLQNEIILEIEREVSVHLSCYGRVHFLIVRCDEIGFFDFTKCFLFALVFGCSEIPCSIA